MPVVLTCAWVAAGWGRLRVTPVAGGIGMPVVLTCAWVAAGWGRLRVTPVAGGIGMPVVLTCAWVAAGWGRLRVARVAQVAGRPGRPAVLPRLRVAATPGRVRPEEAAGAGVTTPGGGLGITTVGGGPGLPSVLPWIGMPVGRGRLGLPGVAGAAIALPRGRLRVTTAARGIYLRWIGVRAVRRGCDRRTALQCFDKPGKIGDRYTERTGAGPSLPDAEYRHARIRVPAEAHGTGVAPDVEENLAEARQRRYVRCWHAAHGGANTHSLSSNIVHLRIVAGGKGDKRCWSGAGRREGPGRGTRRPY